MLTFSVDPRDGGMGANACDTCCCKSIHARPGETNKIVLNYAPWSVPIGNRGLTEQHITSLVKNDPAVPGGGPVVPIPSNFYGETDLDTVLNGDLSDVVVNPSAATLTFALLPMYGPSRGTVVVNADGTFVYTPFQSFFGLDRFFYTVWDNVAGHNPIVKEVVIRVQAAPPAQQFPVPTVADATPDVSVTNWQVQNRYHTVSFALGVSPAAVPGDSYRLTVRQQALDCDCVAYWHVSCYDILIGKCR